MGSMRLLTTLFGEIMNIFLQDLLTRVGSHCVSRYERNGIGSEEMTWRIVPRARREMLVLEPGRRKHRLEDRLAY